MQARFAVVLMLSLGTVGVSSGATLRRAAAPVTYTVDPVHSSILFKIRHMNVADFYGRFNEATGEIVVDEARPEASSVSVEIKTGSVDTHNAERDAHLRSAEFFDAERHAVISFRSTRISDIDDDEIEMEGELTIRGVTRPLSLKLARTGEGPDMWGGQRAGFATEFTIKRSDYGMNAMLSGPNGLKPLGDEVTLIISLEAVRKAAE